MKKLIHIFTLGAILSLIMAAFANAQTIISLNFQGSDATALASTDVTGAGTYAAGNWNNATGVSGGPVALNNSGGTSSGLTLTTYQATNTGVPGTAGNNTTPQQTLFGGGINPNFFW